MPSSLKTMFRAKMPGSKLFMSLLRRYRKPTLKSKLASTPVDSCQIKFLSNILSYYLEDKVGIFVEVGAYDGISFSNTYHLAASGWRGIYCEPVKEYAEKCLRNHTDHPSVSVLQVAISDKDNDLLVMDTAGIFSTASSASKEYFLRQNFSRHHFHGSLQISVPTLTLNTLIKNHSLQHIDVLVVDVEGHEINVLRGLSIADNKPSIVIIELQELQHGKDELSSSYAEARLMLHENQYICVYADLINTIFVERSLYAMQNNLEDK